MFIDPGTGQQYIPTPSYFLGCFDIYDREETLGEALEKFNPNDPSDREKLILRYCLARNRTYRHRFLLYKCLEKALDDKWYDFQSLFKYDPEAYTSFPYGWDEMENTRVFFEDIYRLATVEWKEDLQKASLEDASTWRQQLSIWQKDFMTASRSIRGQASFLQDWSRTYFWRNASIL